MTNYFVEGVTLFSIMLILVGLFAKKMRNSINWRAMSTPLSSIIGSGFIIIAPLLWVLVGKWSLFFLVGIILLSYQIGDVMRFNIFHSEPLIQSGKMVGTFKTLNKMSYFSLGIAYLVSIAFYIHILSAFALSLFGVHDELSKDILSTLILLIIGTLGYIRGIAHLEFIGRIAVNIKIALVCSVCIGVFTYSGYNLGFVHLTPPSDRVITFESLCKIAGILLLVQGFETSRYLGDRYTSTLRVQSMKYAQIFSSIIYIFFVWCMMFVLGDVTSVSETTIIDVLSRFSWLLPLVLVCGGVFSQMSSALADATGCSGLLSESVNNKIKMNQGYLLLSLVAIILIWTTNVLENVALASRLFAFYYLMQSLESLYIMLKYHQNFSVMRLIKFVFVALSMLFVCLFAQSAG